MSEHYKSMISDEEVIKELLKDNKRREGTLSTDSSRLKPNLNFFQRTVNSLVSNNTRIDKSVDTFRTDYLKDKKAKRYRTPVYKYSPTKKPLVDYAFEKQLILQTKINFTKSKDQQHIDNKPYRSNCDKVCPAHLRKIIDEISTDSGDSSNNGIVSCKKKTISKVKQTCHSQEVICLSSDDSSNDKSTYTKAKRKKNGEVDKGKQLIAKHKSREKNK